MTGDVFNSMEIRWTNHINSFPLYMPSIDNLSQIKDVRNIMIAPVLGHKD